MDKGQIKDNSFNPDFKGYEPILPDKQGRPLLSKEEYARLPEKKKVEIMGLV